MEHPAIIPIFVLLEESTRCLSLTRTHLSPHSFVLLSSSAKEKKIPPPPHISTHLFSFLGAEKENKGVPQSSLLWTRVAAYDLASLLTSNLSISLSLPACFFSLLAARTPRTKNLWIGEEVKSTLLFRLTLHQITFFWLSCFINLAAVR